MVGLECGVFASVHESDEVSVSNVLNFTASGAEEIYIGSGANNNILRGIGPFKVDRLDDLRADEEAECVVDCAQAKIKVLLL